MSIIKRKRSTIEKSDGESRVTWERKFDFVRDCWWVLFSDGGPFSQSTEKKFGNSEMAPSAAIVSGQPSVRPTFTKPRLHEDSGWLANWSSRQGSRKCPGSTRVTTYKQQSGNACERRQSSQMRWALLQQRQLLLDMKHLISNLRDPFIGLLSWERHFYVFLLPYSITTLPKLVTIAVLALLQIANK